MTERMKAPFKDLGKKLKKQGFDESYYSRSDRSWKVRCSQCLALTINGIATHERGCPNIKRP